MNKTKRTALLAMSVAIAMVLSFVESQIPALIAVPGVKLGLANIAVIFTLFVLGTPDAMLVSLVRVLLVSLLFGNAVGWLYSVSGAVLSLLIMLLLRKTGLFSTVGISIAGGVSHNIGQVLAAMLVLRTEGVLFYLPPLLIFGAISGALIGICASILINRLGKMLKM